MKKFKPLMLIPVLLIVLAVLCHFVFQGFTEYKDRSSEESSSDSEEAIHVTYEITYLNGELPTDQEMENIEAVLTKSIASELKIEVSAEDTDDEDKTSDITDILGSLLKENKNTLYKVDWVGSNRIEVVFKDAENDISERITTTPELYFIREYDDAGNANYTDPYGMGDSQFIELSEGVTIDSLKESGDIILSAEDIADAQAGIDNSTGAPNYLVELTLTSEGAKKFAIATEEACTNGWTIGIYYDGAFISVPRVQAVITDGKVWITGMTSYESASVLANNISLGNLKFTEVEPDSSNDVLDSENGIGTSMYIAIIGIIVIILILFVFLILGIYKAIVHK